MIRPHFPKPRSWPAITLVVAVTALAVFMWTRSVVIMTEGREPVMRIAGMAMLVVLFVAALAVAQRRGVRRGLLREQPPGNRHVPGGRDREAVDFGVHGEDVRSFIEALESLSQGDWAKVSREGASGHHWPSLSAWSVIRRWLAARKVWMPQNQPVIRSAVVNEILSIAENCGLGADAVHTAADAALAVSFRMNLSAREFELLYEPFEQVIPLSTITGRSAGQR